jgi:ubiquitin-hydrolase Zn-finger-containing protein
VAPTCTHLSQIEVLDMPESVDGCEDCLREHSEWLHLRMCLTCGHVGCCDDSPRHHASEHARESGHVLLRSLEPGEEWSWCFEDQIAFIVPEISGTTRIPPSPLLP